MFCRNPIIYNIYISKGFSATTKSVEILVFLLKTYFYNSWINNFVLSFACFIVPSMIYYIPNSQTWVKASKGIHWNSSLTTIVQQEKCEFKYTKINEMVIMSIPHR